MEENNLYILIPYSNKSLAWVKTNQGEIKNIGNNKVILPMFHPKKEYEMCYQIELSEVQYEKHKAALTLLFAEEALTADQYLEKYPPKQQDDGDILI